MNRKMTWVAGAILTMRLAGLPTADAAETTAPLSAEDPAKVLVSGNTTFAVALYNELAKEPGNMIFSPYSVSLALGMTYAGARGNTAAEMKEALRFSLEPARIPPAFRTLRLGLAERVGQGDQTLAVANGLCLTGGGVGDEYKALLKEQYDADILAGGLEEINGWVKGRTGGKIGTILSKLDPNSVCVLLNAVYFRGLWASPFPKSGTAAGDFSLASGKAVSIQFMRQAGSFPQAADGDIKAVSIPYKGGALSMVVFLPAKANGLPALERQLSEPFLRGWFDRLDEAPARHIDLSLPRFGLESARNLVPSCRNLGMKEAFQAEKADFTGMQGPRVLYLTQVMHSAFVEVNEEGSQAGAATAVEVSTKAMRPSFSVDRPFLFLIRDNATGCILFIGRVENPAAK